MTSFRLIKPQKAPYSQLFGYSQIFRLSLGVNHLNKHLLKRTSILIINDILGPFKNDDVLKDLKLLNQLIIEAANLREYLHSSTNKWITYFNYDVNMDPYLTKTDHPSVLSQIANKSLVLGLSEFLTKSDTFHFITTDLLMLFLNFMFDLNLRRTPQSRNKTSKECLNANHGLDLSLLSSCLLFF